jgi:lysyl-tRNA synthetase class 2
VADAFTHLAGIDLLATLSPDGAGDAAALRARARRGGIEVSDDDDWSDMFSKILTLRVEPRLGMERPCILYEYPVCEAALAQVSPRDGRLAERFELYACGVELANGFGELTDPAVQRTRFERDMAKKEKIYGRRYPLDEDFLAALAHMPPASGVALGFDRLVMLVTGAPNIDAVLWTPLA